MRNIKYIWFIFLAVYFLGQFTYNALHPNSISEDIKISASVGLYKEHFRHFFIGYWYTGRFPVALRLLPEEQPANSKEFFDIVDIKPELLVMEIYHVIRSGDWGKLGLYFPSMLFSSDPRRSDIRFFTGPVFLFSVLLLFYTLAKWYSAFSAGAFLVLTVSSTFFNFELFKSQNIFILFTSVGFIAIAGAIVIFKRILPERKMILTLVILGIFFGLFKQVRSEPIVFLSSIALSIFISPYSRKFKLMGVLTLLSSYLLTKNICQNIWESKSLQAKEYVRSIGGQVYGGPLYGYHQLWHPIACGLADFDTVKGFRWEGYAGSPNENEWNDRAVYKKFNPILKDNYNISLVLENNTPLYLPLFYDRANLYYKHIQDLPEYDPFVRELVLRSILDDKKWYLEILMKRIGSIFENAQSYEFRFGNNHFSIKNSLYFSLILFAILVIARRRFEIALVLFSIPSIAPALLIYSNGGMTLYGVVHYVLVIASIEPIVDVLKRQMWRFNHCKCLSKILN